MGGTTLAPTDVMQLMTRMDALQSQVQNSMSALQGDFREMDTRLKSMHHRVDALTTILTGAEGGGLPGALAVERAERQAVAKDVSILRGSLDQLETDLEGRLDRLQARQDKLLYGLIGSVITGLMALVTLAMKIIGGVPIQ